jgi:hypothetical protein
MKMSQMELGEPHDERSWQNHSSLNQSDDLKNH